MLRNIFLNGLLILGSLVICLIIGEVASRLLFPDTRVRFDTNEERLAALQPNQEGFIYLSDGTRAPRVRINELGVRGAIPGEGADQRILFIGDSFTFGSGVTEEQTFVKLVDEALGERVSVVNGGHPGYGIYQIESLFNDLYPVLKPDVVVLVIWESLILRQRHTKQGHQDFLARMERLNRLKSISVLGTHLYRLYEQVSLSYGADDAVVTLAARKEPEFSTEFLYERAVRLDSERILRIHDTLQADGGELIIVVWPREGYVENDIDIELSGWLVDKYKDLGRAHGIPTYSLQGALESHPPEQMNIPRDGHPTPFAHCLVADRLVSIVAEQGISAQTPVECAEPALVALQ